jgi:rubredoxin
MQPPLFDTAKPPLPAFDVNLECPACGYTWKAATVDPAQWWGQGVKAERIALQCCCPNCDTTEPMRVKR